MDVDAEQRPLGRGKMPEADDEGGAWARNALGGCFLFCIGFGRVSEVGCLSARMGWAATERSFRYHLRYFGNMPQVVPMKYHVTNVVSMLPVCLKWYRTRTT